MARKAPKPYQKRKGGNYYYKFAIDGVMYGPECLHTSDKRDSERMIAEKFAVAAGDAARVRRDGARALGRAIDMTLDQLCTSYWTNHVLEKELKDQTQIGKQLHVIRDTIGPDVPVSMIDDHVVAAFVKARKAYRYGSRSRDPVKVANTPKKPLAPQTRNHELMRLQLLLTHANVVEKIAMQVINWKRFRVPDHLLGTKPKRYIKPDESAAIFASIRPDYRSIIEFALASGLRRRSLVDLTWDKVDEEHSVITLKQKGGRDHLIVITPDIAAILAGERPHKTSSTSHVFTFVADTTMKNNKTGVPYEKGKRYPITYWGLGSYWKVLTKKLGGAKITIHDLRKTSISDFAEAAGLSHASAHAGHSSEEVTEKIYRTIASPARIAAANLAHQLRVDKNRMAPRSKAIVPQIVPQPSFG